MKKITPAEFAATWASTMKARLSQIQAGVARVDEAPGAKAAKAFKTWQARMTDPEVQKRWQANVAAVPLEDWKRATLELLPQRLPGGVDRAVPGVERFAQQLLSYQAANVGKVEAMPNITYEDSRARMNAWFDIMKNFRYKK